MSYTLIDQPISTSILGPWHGTLNNFDQVVGYSSTGTLFLSCAASNEFATFYPAKPGANMKGYGHFDTVGDFEETILKSFGFEMYSLYPLASPDDLLKLQELLGPLEPEEIYIPAPYGFAGGSLELETFAKGNVWVSAAIIAQLLGIPRTTTP